MAVLWDVAPCSLLETDQRFRGASCLYHKDDDGGSKHLWNVKSVSTRLQGEDSHLHTRRSENMKSQQ
jgi:hypothetical protein